MSMFGSMVPHAAEFVSHHQQLLNLLEDDQCAASSLARVQVVKVTTYHVTKQITHFRRVIDHAHFQAPVPILSVGSTGRFVSRADHYQPSQLVYQSMPIRTIHSYWNWINFSQNSMLFFTFSFTLRLCCCLNRSVYNVKPSFRPPSEISGYKIKLLADSAILAAATLGGC